VKGKRIKLVFLTLDSYREKKRERGGNASITIMGSGPFGN
jgi:hypothetical protein